MASRSKDRSTEGRSGTRTPAKQTVMGNEPPGAEEPATISRHELRRTAASDDRRREIAEEAYYRAERRGFVSGFEESDWLEAEHEVERRHGRASGASVERAGDQAGASAREGS